MNSDQIQDLVERHLADLLTDDEKAELAKWLDEDSEHRARFRECIELEYHLDAHLGEAVRHSDEALTPVSVTKPVAPVGFREWIPLGWAAAAMIAMALGWMLWSSGAWRAEAEDSVAVLSRVSSDAIFREDHELPRREGSRLGKGWVLLERGSVEITFQSGAKVGVTGPAALGIDTPMRAYLDFGKATVHAGESCRDFVVATESMEVVDLGTRFEVEVDPQSRESNVLVTEGLVDLHLGSRGADRTIRALEAGYAARVDGYGEILEITGVGSGTKPSAGLLAHWKFDEWGNGGKMTDSSGRHLHGIVGGTTRAPLVPGKSGQALEFSGAESVDLRAHLAALGALDAFTFATWIRYSGEPPALGMLFSISGDSERERVQLYLARGFVRYGWQNGPLFDSISGRVDGWESGRWYHVAFTMEGGIARLYRDGELIASGSVGSRFGMPVSSPSQVRNPSHAYLGWLADGRQGKETAPQWFEGRMDDVQIYSGSLTPEGIQFLFENPGQAWTQSRNR